MAYRTQRTGTKVRTNHKRNENYIQGNTVRKLNIAEEIQKPSQTRELSHSTRKNRDKALYMNMGYVLFLVAALVSAGIILINYIKIQSDLTMAVKRIANMERDLNDLKLSNDENYGRAASSVDLEEIRRVAIGELGMRYAKEDQIISVSGEGSDYVRQLSEFD